MMVQALVTELNTLDEFEYFNENFRRTAQTNPQ